ncbi:multidrug effflux MFS transporter [Ectobacillus ponti]|uniref:Bcr/CflA family efflux transporter n=1 Tax=Ectobacillus ponti TaxID=2961894 RepID=A0AA41X6T5_9BACI|nr:multidrug effflux MFS transporter [Ectobacillus ponti]MCP8969996.1 multidrug effflux MFS transporter [Ectobacillus ponti]
MEATLSKGKRLGIAAILGSLAAFAPLSIDMYLPALPELAADFHAAPSLAQLSLTFFLLGLASGQLLSGPLSDVYGRRRPLLIGLAAYTVISLLCVFTPSIGLFIALRFLQGLSGSAGIVISRAVVRDLYVGPELTKFFALLALVNGVAPILAPVIGAQLLRFAPWQGVFAVLGGIGLTMFFVVLFGLAETLPAQRRSQGGIGNTVRTFGRILGDRSFVGYALSQGLVFAAMFSYISGSPFVVQTIYGASAQTFSLIFAMNGIGIMIASQTTGRLAGIVGERKFLAAGLGACSIGGLLLLLAVSLHAPLWVVLIPLFFVVSSNGMVGTSSFSLAMQTQGKSAGSASALLGVMSMALGGLAAPLVGLGGGASAVPMGLVIALLGVGAVLSYTLLVRKTAQ